MLLRTISTNYGGRQFILHNPINLFLTIAQTGNTQKITDWVNPNDKSGEFKRQQSVFRNFISREPGAQFPPEKGRYHLYVSYACPWGESIVHLIGSGNVF